MKIFLFFLFIAKTGFSQKLTPIIISLKYETSYNKDSLNQKIEMFNLDITDSFSKYYSEDKRMGDSLLKIDVSNGISLENKIANSGKYNQDKGNITIYNSNQKLNVYEKIIGKYYTYADSFPENNWVLSSDTITINTLHCQKATTSFRGRDYIAWFAKEIPIYYGPWKFYGLPGLIVKIYDTKKKYNFELKRIVKTNGTDSLFLNKNNFIRTNLLKITNFKLRLIENPIGEMEIATGSKISIDSGNLAVQEMILKAKKEYDPIELKLDN